MTGSISTTRIRFWLKRRTCTVDTKHCSRGHRANQTQLKCGSSATFHFARPGTIICGRRNNGQSFPANRESLCSAFYINVAVMRVTTKLFIKKKGGPQARSARKETPTASG